MSPKRPPPSRTNARAAPRRFLDGCTWSQADEADDDDEAGALVRPPRSPASARTKRKRRKKGGKRRARAAPATDAEAPPPPPISPSPTRGRAASTGEFTAAHARLRAGQTYSTRLQHTCIRTVSTYVFRCLKRTRREQTTRPKISRNDVDSTERERFEVLLDRSIPLVVSGTGAPPGRRPAASRRPTRAASTRRARPSAGPVDVGIISSNARAGDHRRALPAFERLAAAGDGRAAYNAAHMRSKGHGADPRGRRRFRGGGSGGRPRERPGAPTSTRLALGAVAARARASTPARAPADAQAPTRRTSSRRSRCSAAARSSATAGARSSSASSSPTAAAASPRTTTPRASTSTPSCTRPTRRPKTARPRAPPRGKQPVERPRPARLRASLSRSRRRRFG